MRIKQLNQEDFETMIEGVAIRYRVKCDDMNTIIIRQTLQSEFANYHVNEFNDAFIKHCSGKFMISKTSEGNKPYGDLSAQFVCEVLNGYKQHKAKYHKVLPIPLTDESKLIAVKKMNKEENAKHWFDWIVKEIEKNGKIPQLADWDAIFWWMEKESILKFDKEEKEMFVENVKFEIQEDINFRKLEKRDCTFQQRMLKSELSLKLECRKRLVKKHFENLKHEENTN